MVIPNVMGIMCWSPQLGEQGQVAVVTSLCDGNGVLLQATR